MKKYYFLLLAIFTICVCFLTCKKEISVTGISLNKNMLELFRGDTITLVATVQPENTANNKVIWASSNPAVATVTDNGFVRVIDFGSATITVKTQDGSFTDSCIMADFRSKYIGNWDFVKKESSIDFGYYSESVSNYSGRIELDKNEQNILIPISKDAILKFFFMDKEVIVCSGNYAIQGKFYIKNKVVIGGSGGSMNGSESWEFSIDGTKLIESLEKRLSEIESKKGGE